MNSMENAVFDVTRPILLSLRSPEGVKAIRVRFPSDEEWIERQRRRKVITKHLGRGVSEMTVVGGEDSDAALLAKIRIQEGPDLDAFEAQKILEMLSEAEVDDVEVTGNAVRVTLRVPGATTVHVLRIPSVKDAMEHRRGFVRILDLPYGRQELRINLLPVAALYKKLAECADGYVGEVPIIHQAAALKAVLDVIDSIEQEGQDANFRQGSGPSSHLSAS